MIPICEILGKSLKQYNFVTEVERCFGVKASDPKKIFLTSVSTEIYKAFELNIVRFAAFANMKFCILKKG